MIWCAARWDVIVTMAISLLGCSEPAAKRRHREVLIESDAPTADSVSVELTTLDGTDPREEAGIALPYTLEFSVDYSKLFNFRFSEISATASASASFITCRIFYDDKQMTESTAKGNASTVNCQGDKWPLCN